MRVAIAAASGQLGAVVAVATVAGAVDSREGSVRAGIQPFRTMCRTEDVAVAGFPFVKGRAPRW